MREILFRGKRIDNGKWAYGCYANCAHPCGPEEYTYHYIITYPGGPKDYHEIFTITVGQYAGLKDKNVRRIFEGDIVQGCGCAEEYIGVVRFGEYGEYGSDDTMEHLGFYIEWKRGDGYKVLCHDIIFWVDQGLEVIGNIHDNPELLEAEKA